MDLTLAEQALLDVLDGRALHDIEDVSDELLDYIADLRSCTTYSGSRAMWVPQDNYTEVMRTYNDRVPRV